MDTRKQSINNNNIDLFLDELEYLIGPIQGIYKTTKNARKYIISGLNSIDEQLKPITYASFNNNLKNENAIQYIDHWINYLQKMKLEIERFQNLNDFEQNALKIRINFMNKKYNQFRRENNKNMKSYKDKYPFYHFPYSNDDKAILNIEERENNNKEERDYGQDRHYKSIWIDRLLIDYLSRNEYFQTSYALLMEDNNLTILTNIRLYHKIRDALYGLKKRDATSIIKWCRTNKTLLKQYKNNLEFMAKSRIVIQILRNGDIINAAEYITNEMNKDLEINNNNNDNKWRWNQISQLFTCFIFVPIMFIENEKYKSLLKAKYKFNQNKTNKELKKYYIKCKKEYKSDLKKKIPKNVYKLFFKPKYFWDKMKDEFWRIFKLIYGLNKHSMLEYVLSSSLQTLITPYCYHKEWNHPNCITCVYGRNKISKLCHKSHIRGIEIPYTLIVADKESNINHKDIKNKEYKIIRNQMINNEQTLLLTKNTQATVTPNGCIISKQSSQVLIGTNVFVKKDFETIDSKIFLYYDLF